MVDSDLLDILKNIDFHDILEIGGQVGFIHEGFFGKAFKGEGVAEMCVDVFHKGPDAFIGFSEGLNILAKLVVMEVIAVGKGQEEHERGSYNQLPSVVFQGVLLMDLTKAGA